MKGWIRHHLKAALDPRFRRLERERRGEFLRFKQACGPSLQHRLRQARAHLPKALVVGSGFAQAVKVELGLIKGLELAGFEPVVLTSRDPWLAKYYELDGVDTVRCWEDFLGAGRERPLTAPSRRCPHPRISSGLSGRGSGRGGLPLRRRSGSCGWGLLTFGARRSGAR